MMIESASACSLTPGITKHKFHILDEPGEQALGIGAEEFSLGAFGQSRPVDCGLGAIGKGHAGVRVISREHQLIAAPLVRDPKRVAAVVKQSDAYVVETVANGKVTVSTFHVHPE